MEKKYWNDFYIFFLMFRSFVKYVFEISCGYYVRVIVMCILLYKFFMVCMIDKLLIYFFDIYRVLLYLGMLFYS